MYGTRSRSAPPGEHDVRRKLRAFVVGCWRLDEVRLRHVRELQVTGAEATESAQVAQRGASRREDVIVLRQRSQKPRRALGAVPGIVRQVIHAADVELADLFEHGLLDRRHAGGQQPFWTDIAAGFQHLRAELLQARRAPSVKPPIDTVLPEGPVVRHGQIADDDLEAQRFGGGVEMRSHVDRVRVADQ